MAPRITQPHLHRVLEDVASLVNTDVLKALTKTRHALAKAADLVEVASGHSQATLEPIESTARRLLRDSGPSQQQEAPKLSRFSVYSSWTPSAGHPAHRSISLNKERHHGTLLGHNKKISDPGHDWIELGATLEVTGPNSERERVEGILAVATFGTFHSLLENCFYHDLGLKRFQPEPEPESESEPELPPPSPSAKDEPKSPNSVPETPASLSRSSTGSKKWSLWNMFSNKAPSPGPSPPSSPDLPTSPVKAARSLSLRLKPKFKRRLRNQPPSIVSSLRTVPGGSTIKASRQPHLDAWETLAPEPGETHLGTGIIEEAGQDQAAPDPLSTSGVAEDLPELKPEEWIDDRFGRLVDRIAHTILSASPDVSVFPPPQILLRLKEQESQHACSDRISVDARAGLASLVPNNTSIEGSIYHQSLLFLRERCSLYARPSEPPCDKLGWARIPYYEFPSHEGGQVAPDALFASGRDVRLEEMIEALTAGKGRLCSSSACARPAQDHAFYLTHRTTRCAVTVRGGSEYEIKACSPDSSGIWTWWKCPKCGSVSRPNQLSAHSLLMSSG